MGGTIILATKFAAAAVAYLGLSVVIGKKAGRSWRRGKTWLEQVRELL